ncbi:LPS assembly lipoprotein LptE [Roseospira navarrensis]|uniref:LPS-assembly lipoprotein n=1 Tax=Roseospira navarrensis TaxID=140058 RepID=A0A7X1ZBR1_9PROT|nr:LPS assembly lipoprotein LptE [Roseospira navarrensis]MQX35624.1 hypothetical protein [Roseospira navarrensis]
MSRPAAIARRAVLAAGPLLALAGCGFRPVYGTRGRGGPQLPSVAVGPISERVGQLLRNALLHRLQTGPNPRYELQVTVTVTTGNLGIRRDDEATLANLNARANWSLAARREDGRPLGVADGSTRSSAVYNVLDNQYATDRNRAKTEADMAQILAADIEMQVVAYFAKRGSGGRYP